MHEHIHMGGQKYGLTHVPELYCVKSCGREWGSPDYSTNNTENSTRGWCNSCSFAFCMSVAASLRSEGRLLGVPWRCTVCHLYVNFMCILAKSHWIGPKSWFQLTSRIAPNPPRGIIKSLMQNLFSCKYMMIFWHTPQHGIQRPFATRTQREVFYST